MILEPDRFYMPDYNLRNFEKRNLDEMFKAVMDSELLHSLLAKSETEVSQRLDRQTYRPKMQSQIRPCRFKRQSH